MTAWDERRASSVLSCPTAPATRASFASDRDGSTTVGVHQSSLRFRRTALDALDHDWHHECGGRTRQSALHTKTTHETTGGVAVDL